MTEEIGSKIPSNSITPRVKIIDGDMLISEVLSVKWSKGEAFSQIVQKFAHYILDRAGGGSIICFDGYNKEDIKPASQRNREPLQAREIHVQRNTVVDCRKNTFAAIQRKSSR